jgi:serine/threonine-protein kinase
MDQTRWARVQEVFAAALSLPEPQRGAHISDASANDPALEREVLALLRADATTSDRPADIVRAAADTLLEQTKTRLEARLLGPWRIVSHLADGGMGAVYLAERADGAYQQRAAVKLLNPALVSAQTRARLEVERGILARLAHRHIARLIDGGATDDGAPYLVMEYVDGVPIDRYCDEHDLGTVARLRLVQQVCGAVEHAHRNLIVHRDLKPANILVDREGLPKLPDFGIAKLIDDDAGLTRADQRVLTPAHASPEQLRGEAITTATDVYALGVLLYQLLARRQPFPTDVSKPTHAAQFAREILKADPLRPSQALPQESARLRRELAGDLDNIVLKALQKDPQRRHAIAAALAADIENYLQLRPVGAHGDSLAYRLGRACARA